MRVERERVASSEDSASKPSVSFDPSGAPTLEGDPELAPPRRERDPRPGTTIGRYVVITRLGAGGMGVVYSAHDPDLDRKVALKLLRVRGRAPRSRGHQRLLAEAQALARLSHPNVVAVHDVGEHEGQVFVAMEFVAGQTLGAWLAKTRPRWSEVLDVMLQAGRGIQAAHACGLVHRDLKPDNVMRGDDGRVRVMDFGLARAMDPTQTHEDNGESEFSRSGRSSRLLDQLQTFGLAGTPAYMAPEQILGSRGDHASDQFSLCVTLWEALFGARPFEGQTVVEIRTAILEGAIVEPPASARVPVWLRRVVERGLSIEPSTRWPSVGALLQALERRRARARRRPWLLSAGLVGLVAAGGWGWQAREHAQRVRACEAEGETIAEIWNDDVASELALALLTTKAVHAEQTVDKVVPLLHAQAQAWQQARTQACLDAEVEGTWNAQTHDRARWCLDERRDELQALLTELLRGQASAVTHAVPATSGLSRIEPCRDTLVLSRLPPPPQPADRNAVVQVRGQLMHALALERVGDYDGGLQAASVALDEAEALAWPPLVATARASVGIMHHHLGDYPEAERVLEQAYFEAGRADATGLAADLAHQLGTLVGLHLSRHADGLRWVEHQTVALARTPDPIGLGEASQLHLRGRLLHEQGEYEPALDHLDRATRMVEHAVGSEHLRLIDILDSLAIVHQDMGDYDAAVAMQQRVLALRTQVLGAGHPDVAQILNNLAVTHRAKGDASEAKALYEQALDIWKASLGPEHPFVAQALNNLGNANFSLGNYDASMQQHQRALAIREASMDPDAPEVAESLGNVANLYSSRGEYAKAEPLLVRAAEIYERALGPDHPKLALALGNLGLLRSLVGQPDSAKESLERALAIRERALGPDHPLVAHNLENLGDVYAVLDQVEPAKRSYARSLKIAQSALGPEHPMCAYARLGLAEVAKAEGRPADAVAQVERAIEILTAAEASSMDLADARFALARARWALGPSHHADAIALAKEARATYEIEGNEVLVEEIGQWLADADADGREP